MKSVAYLAGRVFQITGLIALPSAIWVGHFGRDERGAIAIFLASVFVFFAGYLLTRLAARL
ncbi:MAG: hypothetical protein ACREH5_07340 [Candidatus Omnitrophota bacterium]